MISATGLTKKHWMGPISVNGKIKNGFTLMELLVVLLLIALLASIVTPIVVKSINRAKESALRENLFILRKAIDDYYSDKGKYPESLQLLVEDRYVRIIPTDPVIDSGKEWLLLWDDSAAEGETESGGIIDLHSVSPEIASDGTAYDTW